MLNILVTQEKVKLSLNLANYLPALLSCGNEFYSSIMYCERKYFLLSVLNWSPFNFTALSLVLRL